MAIIIYWSSDNWILSLGFFLPLTFRIRKQLDCTFFLSLFFTVIGIKGIEMQHKKGKIYNHS